jgi:branched-chain amino acid transport system permease protein
VCLLLVLAHNLRSGRLGRILAAMRDSETATEAIGIELRRYKLFIFAVSAFIAGIGGSLLAQQSKIFSGEQFDPITGLLWFTVVVVAGSASLWGAVLGGGVFVLLDVVLHTQGASQLVIAGGALLLGYIPGGSLVGLVGRAFNNVARPRGLQRVFSEALSEGRAHKPSHAPAYESNGHEAVGELVPTEFARRVLGGSGTR